MAVTIDQIEATVEAEQHPAPPAETSAHGTAQAVTVQAIRATLAQIAQREARLRAD